MQQFIYILSVSNSLNAETSVLNQRLCNDEEIESYQDRLTLLQMSIDDLTPSTLDEEIIYNSITHLTWRIKQDIFSA